MRGSTFMCIHNACTYMYMHVQYIYVHMHTCIYYIHVHVCLLCAGGHSDSCQSTEREASTVFHVQLEH